MPLLNAAVGALFAHADLSPCDSAPDARTRSASPRSRSAAEIRGSATAITPFGWEPSRVTRRRGNEGNGWSASRRANVLHAAARRSHLP